MLKNSKNPALIGCPFKNINLKDLCTSQPLIALKINVKNLELMQMIIKFLK